MNGSPNFFKTFLYVSLPGKKKRTMAPNHLFSLIPQGVAFVTPILFKMHPIKV